MDSELILKCLNNCFNLIRDIVYDNKKKEKKKKIENTEYEEPILKYNNEFEISDLSKYPYLKTYLSCCKLNTFHYMVKKVNDNLLVNSEKQTQDLLKAKFNNIRVKRLHKINPERIGFTFFIDELFLCIFFLKDSNDTNIEGPTIPLDKYEGMELTIMFALFYTNFFVKWMRYGYIAILKYIKEGTICNLLLCKIIYELFYFHCKVQASYGLAPLKQHSYINRRLTTHIKTCKTLRKTRYERMKQELEEGQKLKQEKIIKRRTERKPRPKRLDDILEEIRQEIGELPKLFF